MNVITKITIGLMVNYIKAYDNVYLEQQHKEKKDKTKMVTLTQTINEIKQLAFECRMEVIPNMDIASIYECNRELKTSCVYSSAQKLKITRALVFRLRLIINK